MGRPGADAIAIGTALERVCQARIRGQTQVVIGAERQHTAPVDYQLRSLPTVGDAPRTVQAVGLALFEGFMQIHHRP